MVRTCTFLVSLSLRYYQNNIFFTYRTVEPCCNLELDTKVQTSKGFSKRRMIAEYIIDETLLKISSKLIWLWAAIK